MTDHPPPLHAAMAGAPEGGRAFWLDVGETRLRAAVWAGGGRGAALIFTGRTEYIEKYGRVIGALTRRGFAVATLDWRGQGLSERALPDPLRGHVDDFADYQKDVAALLASPETAALPRPRVLICHSMGGCIGMRSLVDGTLKPAATIMSAPMLGIRLSAAMRFGAKAMIRVARRFGFETSFAPAPKANMPYVSHQPFEGNLLTNDREHYEWMVSHLKAEPRIALAAPTLGWMARAFAETDALAAAPPPETPMLMMLGGSEEIVEPGAIRAFAARAPSCRLVELADAQHEIFMETEAVRAKAWAEIDGFLREAGV